MTAYFYFLSSADHRIVLPLLYSCISTKSNVKFLDDIKGRKKRAIPMTISI